MPPGLDKYACALKHLPKEFRIEELCCLVVLNNGYSLAYVLHYSRTVEMPQCRGVAVEQDAGHQHKPH